MTNDLQPKQVYRRLTGVQDQSGNYFKSYIKSPKRNERLAETSMRSYWNLSSKIYLNTHTHIHTHARARARAHIHIFRTKGQNCQL